MAKSQSLSKEEILHLAKLAKLHLTDSEIEKYQAQLGETIEYVKNLDELDTKNVEPTNSVVDLKNITFKDGEKSTRTLVGKQALANTKKQKDQMFEVDRIL